MNKTYHFIGIGGIGMSGIAQLLLRSGKSVSGSDLKENKVTQELKKLGAKIYLGHRAENIHEAGLVVYSSAIKDDNPEFAEAKNLGIPLIKRAQALAELMQDKSVITVSGSHGKTTTTSLVSYLLMQAGLCPSVAVGGILRNIGSNACLGDGKFFVAEADESDGSFLYYHPKYSIITNIDHEHLDYYKDFESEVLAFRQFLNNTVEGGCVFACDDDPHIKSILFGYKGKYVLFGLTESADVYPKNINLQGLSSEFDCYRKGKLIGRFCLSLGGMHNVSNALSAIALALELGIDLEFVKKALASYKGAGRRLEIKFEGDGITLIDDYAHHPTEIQATLSAANNLSHKRMIAIFQPHRYTRTKLLLNEFAKSFTLADAVIITDIYAASEQPIEGVSGKSIFDKIKGFSPDKEAYYLPKTGIADFVLGIAKPGDLIIALGAGDIIKVCEEMAGRFNDKVLRAVKR